MKPNEPSARVGTGTVTLIPEAPHTTRMPAWTSAIGNVRTTSAPPSCVDDQAAVHLGVAYVDPVPVEPDLGLEVGAGVEAVREDAVLLGRADLRLAGVDLVDPMDLQAHQDPLEGVLGRRRHVDPRVRRVVGPVTDVEVLDDVVTAVLVDVVEDAGQGCGVDQVPADLDDLVVCHVVPSVVPAHEGGWRAVRAPRRRRGRRGAASWRRPGRRTRRRTRP